LGNAFKYLHENMFSVQLSYTGHSIVSQFISLLTTAKCKPVGSLPMAKQNSMTCITGSANMNNITLRTRHRPKT